MGRPSTPTSEASTKVGAGSSAMRADKFLTPSPKARRRKLSTSTNGSAPSPRPDLTAPRPRSGLGIRNHTELVARMVEKDRACHRDRARETARNVFLFLLAFRVLNALCVRTFFQPDEYFQALEPAWRMAFGEESGAWITWVCDRVSAMRFAQCDCL